MGVMWTDAILVDWRVEEEHLVYPWRDWGVERRPDGDDEIEEIAIDPEFGLDGPSPLM